MTGASADRVGLIEKTASKDTYWIPLSIATGTAVTRLKNKIK